MCAQAQIVEIFDRQLVRRQRNRAAPAIENHNFLINWAYKNLLDRLEDIKRDFPLTLQIGGRAQTDRHSAIKKLITLDIAENYLGNAEIAVQADEEFLPFAENALDMIISPLSLHTVNDLPGALIQINRALKPDGLFLGALLGGETLFELRDCMMQAELNIKGGASPRVAPFADKQQLGALLQRAGFALPVVDSEIVTVTYDDIYKLMRDLRGMGESNSLKDRSKKPLGRKMLAETERLYKEKFSEKDGRIEASFEVIFLIGWAPHKSQQQPLRPGSADIRLADVLKTKEVKA